MNAQDIALALAGLIGGGVAIVHGVLIQRLMVALLGRHYAETGRASGPIARLTGPLLQFSTFAWLLAGVALIAAATLLGRDARLPLALFVGALYAFGAIANLQATRGRHPGWMLMTIAVALIGYGLFS